MYFNKMGRSNEYKNELKNFIEKKYPFKINSLTEYKRGWYGETWKVVSNEKSYFIKICYSETNKRNFARCFRVLDYMRDNGINNILTAVATKTGNLYSKFDSGILGVFNFVEGLHTEDYPLEDLIKLLVKIYKLPLPKKTKLEEFDFAKLYSDYEKRIQKLKETTHYEFIKLIEKSKDLLNEIYLQAKKYATLCKKEPIQRFITNGDVGGNVIWTDDKMTIVDWDDIILAPAERDLWFYACDFKQINFINSIFEKENLDYRLSKSKLGYYANSRYFYYLTEAIDCLFFAPESKSEILNWMKQHLDETQFVLKIIKDIEEKQK